MAILVSFCCHSYGSIYYIVYSRIWSVYIHGSKMKGYNRLNLSLPVSVTVYVCNIRRCVLTYCMYVIYVRAYLHTYIPSTCQRRNKLRAWKSYRYVCIGVGIRSLIRPLAWPACLPGCFLKRGGEWKLFFLSLSLGITTAATRTVFFFPLLSSSFFSAYLSLQSISLKGESGITRRS